MGRPGHRDPRPALRRRGIGFDAGGLAVRIEVPPRGRLHPDARGRLVRPLHRRADAGCGGRWHRAGWTGRPDWPYPSTRGERSVLFDLRRPGGLCGNPGPDAGASVPRGVGRRRGLAQRGVPGGRVLARQVPTDGRWPHGRRLERRHPAALASRAGLDTDS